MTPSIAATHEPFKETRAMRRMERTQLLERLCELRALYALCGDDDRVGVVSVTDAMALASEALDAAEEATTPLPGTGAA
jgi:hypothetical protein